MNHLPIEIITKILEYIPFSDWFSIKVSCKTLNAISDKVFDPSIDNNILIWSCISGNIFSTIYLLNYKFHLDEAFPVAILVNNIEAIKMMMNMGIDIDSYIDSILDISCRNGYTDMLKLFSNRINEYHNVGILLYEACEKGNTDIVKLILKYGDNLNESSCEALIQSLMHRNMDIFYILVDSEKISISMNDNCVLHYVCTHGNIDAVKYLLFHDKFSITGYERSLSDACLCEHIDVVRVLLSHKDVDPSVNYNSPLKNAIYSKNIDIVKLLFENEKLNIDPDNSNLIKYAHYNGNIEIIKYLLKDGRFDPSVNNNMILRDACSNSNMEEIYVLLEDKRIDPSVPDNSILEITCKSGNIEVADILLKDKRVYSSINIDILSCMCRYNYINMIKYLSDKRELIKFKSNIYDLMYHAGTNGNVEIVKILANNVYLPRKEKGI
jgi:ankyrin repeat protein